MLNESNLNDDARVKMIRPFFCSKYAGMRCSTLHTRVHFRKNEIISSQIKKRHKIEYNIVPICVNYRRYWFNYFEAEYSEGTHNLKTSCLSLNLKLCQILRELQLKTQVFLRILPVNYLEFWLQKYFRGVSAWFKSVFSWTLCKSSKSTTKHCICYKTRFWKNRPLCHSGKGNL